MRKVALCLVLVSAFISSVDAENLVAVPQLQTRVTDLTGTLSASENAELSKILADYEKEKGSQIAVLILPSTRPETIEQYSIRVAEQWKIGRKGVDDGVLLIVAKEDRKLRIEVGYGLEGVLPDAKAKDIIDEVIVPYFKNGDFYGGVKIGVETIIATIKNEPLPPPKFKPDAKFAKQAATAIGMGIVVSLIVGAILSALPVIRHLIALTIYLVILYFVGLLFGSSMASLVHAGITGLFLLGVRYLGGTSAGKAWNSDSSSSWSSSSSSSSSSWSSSGSSSDSDSSSTSGGGGSFGGGGASGSW
ncbi:MAG TPA: YgcG family protein [Leptospiraceae bacterium]|nr:YgcG family protein [Leptospirales bacterium]HMX56493.1 YgcG family protein [Leptospiraceae bacterium]HMY47444.1 YgcG family protein [Leptospiraceae bacterium]HMZ36209.1 YgcG family protein [Leptospiraceae bacterium]HNJ34021.1 YgcG family protein [Leptospiraceae bacterium]